MYNRYLDADLDGENDTFDKSAFDRNYLAAGNSVEVSGRAWSPSALWYGYTGRQLDPETGLMHYRARAYHPTLKQFTRRDPMGYLDSASLYQYVAGKPLWLADPFGLQAGGAAAASVVADALAAIQAAQAAVRAVAAGLMTVEQASKLIQIAVAAAALAFGEEYAHELQKRFKEQLDDLVGKLNQRPKTPPSAPPKTPPPVPPTKGPEEKPGDGPIVEGEPNEKPPWTGPPNGKWKQRPPGKKERTFGPDGLPWEDVEPDHEGDGTHTHPWFRDKDGNLLRGKDGKPIRGTKIPVPKCD